MDGHGVLRAILEQVSIDLEVADTKILSCKSVCLFGNGFKLPLGVGRQVGAFVQHLSHKTA